AGTGDRGASAPALRAARHAGDQAGRAELQPVRELGGKHAGEVAVWNIEDAERRALLLEPLARLVEQRAAQRARAPVDSHQGGDQLRQAHSTLRVMKTSLAPVCHARMNSLGSCAWADLPLPHPTLRTPGGFFKLPASVPQTAP